MTAYKLTILFLILFTGIFSSFQDIKEQKIYKYPVFASCLLVIICHGLFNFSGMWIYLLSGLFSFVFYFAARQISGKKFGTGDIYFGVFQGLCLEFKFFPFCVILEVIFSVLAVLVLRIKKSEKSEQKSFPFIPFMTAALLILFVLIEKL